MPPRHASRAYSWTPLPHVLERSPTRFAIRVAPENPSASGLRRLRNAHEPPHRAPHPPRGEIACSASAQSRSVFWSVTSVPFAVYRGGRSSRSRMASVSSSTVPAMARVVTLTARRWPIR